MPSSAQLNYNKFLKHSFTQEYAGLSEAIKNTTIFFVPCAWDGENYKTTYFKFPRIFRYMLQPKETLHINKGTEENKAFVLGLLKTIIGLIIVLG